MANYSFKVKAILDGVDIQKQLETLSKSSMVPDVKLKLSGMSELADLQKEIVSSGGGVVQTYKALGDTFDATTKYAKNLTTGEMELVSATNNFASAQKRADQATQQTVKNQQSIDALKIRVEGLTQAQRDRIKAEETLAKINTTTNLKEQTTLIQGLTKDISAVSYGVTNFAASMEYAVQRFMQIGIIYAVLRKAKEAISDMINVVTSLNTSLVEVQKVTDLTGDSLKQFAADAYEVGNRVARTGQEVINATAVFARSGYEIKDALDLAEVATVMANVGDGIKSVEDASTSLIAVLKGYNLEASNAIDVTNLINEVSNNAAINFADLTEGLTRTSAVFNQAGVSIEKTTGLLTGSNEILQNINIHIANMYNSAYVQKCA